MEAAQAPESIKDRISIPFPSNRAERSESFAILRYRYADGARLTAVCHTEAGFHSGDALRLHHSSG
jgi:hypothetical protein